MTFTNRSIGWRGRTTPVTTRIMDPVLEMIDSRVGQPGFPNRTSVIQHALAVWAMVEEARQERNGSHACDLCGETEDVIYVMGRNAYLCYQCRNE